MLSDFGMLLMTVFSGVFSMAIGFIVFVLIALLLALPYFLIQRKEDMKRDENAASSRY